jgi:hypothetical protein
MSRLALALLLALFLAAPAQAEVTASSITNLPDPQFLLVDLAAPPVVAVSGKATGSGNIDIVCERGGVTSVLAPAVPVTPGGDFATPPVPLALPSTASPTAPGELCRLRALPGGRVPQNLDAFAGPRLAISKAVRLRLTAGPNENLVYDTFVHATGNRFAASSLSFGAGGLFLGYVRDPSSLGLIRQGFRASGGPVDDPTTGHFGVEVDGAAAYPPGTAGRGIAGGWFGDNAGIRPLVADIAHFDPTNGDLTVRETDPLVKCGPSNAYPPTPASCTQFADVPVVLQRTTEYTQDAKVIRVVDRWSSTDGRPHRLDLVLDQQRCFGPPDCSEDVAHRAPGQTAFAIPRPGAVVGPIPAHGRILSREAHDASLGGTTIIVGQVADAARFVTPDEFALEYRARTVPASGALTITHTYVQGLAEAPTTPKPTPRGGPGPVAPTIAAPASHPQWPRARATLRTDVPGSRS